jgi:hypothetical protein
MKVAAASVSAGAFPSGAVAAANRRAHAAGLICTAHPTSTFASVAKCARVVVCVPFNPSGMMVP